LCEHRNVGGFGGGHAREVVVTAPGGGRSEANTAGQTTLTVTAPGRGCHDITALIEAELAPGGGLGVGRGGGGGGAEAGTGGGTAAAAVHTGWLNLFIQHTSASLAVYDSYTSQGPASGARLEAALNRAVPESWNEEFFVHTHEGPDDMPGHVKSSLMRASITVRASAR